MSLDGGFLIFMWVALAVIIGLVVFGLAKYLKNRKNVVNVQQPGAGSPPRA